MPIGRFIAGLIFTLIVVALWSWQDGANAGAIVLRLIAAAFIVQFGYFVGIYILARREANVDEATDAKDATSPAPASRRPSLDT
ncbi:MAG: exopolysaccharide production repressor exox [Mesorhizobium sp.]